MKKLCVLILVFVSCLACDSLDDWTTKDVLNDGGTDSGTSADGNLDSATLLEKESPPPWPDCNTAFDGWIAGNALPQDVCAWQSSFETKIGVCTRPGYGTVYCMENKLGMLCDDTNPHALEDATMQCAWQEALDTDTGVDSATATSNDVFTACDAALTAWIGGIASPGDPCEGWGATGMDESCELAGYGEIFCLAGKLAVQCPEGGALLDDATDECQWEHDTAPDAPWEICEEALEAWIIGAALPGDACTWETSMWGGGTCSREGYGEVYCVDGKLAMACTEGFGVSLVDPDDKCDGQAQGTDIDTDTSPNGPWTDCLAAYDAWTAGTVYAGAECDFTGEICGRQTGTVTCVHGALQTNCGSDTDPASPDWMTENDTGCGFWTDCEEALTGWIAGDALPGDPCAWNADSGSAGSCMEPGHGIMTCSAGTGLTVTCPVTAESGELRLLTNPSEVCEWQEGDTDTAVDTDTTPVSWSDCSAALYAAMNLWEARPGDACTFPDGTMCGDYLFGWVYCEDYKLRMNCDFTDTDYNSPHAYTEPDQLCPIE